MISSGESQFLPGGPVPLVIVVPPETQIKILELLDLFGLGYPGHGMERIGQTKDDPWLTQEAIDWWLRRNGLGYERIGQTKDDPWLTQEAIDWWLRRNGLRFENPTFDPWYSQM